MKQHEREMGRQWTGSEMGKKIKGNGYPQVVPLAIAGSNVQEGTENHKRQ